MRRLAFNAVSVLLVAWSACAGAQTQPQPTPRQTFVADILANFAAWDTNHDGKLDADEVGRAVRDPLVTGDDASTAAALKMAIRSKKAPKFPDWTREYFQSTDATIDFLARSFRTARTRLHQATSQILPNGALTLSECKQGALGDCYLVAATGAAIVRDPAIVTKMLHVDPSGTGYTVNYPDGEEVKVQPLSQGELAMGGAAIRDGMWMRILEKAWGLRAIATSKKYDANADPLDISGHGGSVRFALQVMTGHKVESFRLGNTPKGANVTPEKLSGELVSAIQAHRLIGAATPKTESVPGISPNHAYAVLGFDATTGRIDLWNPHVNHFTPKGETGMTAGYPTTEGRFTMPLADFMAAFSNISIETDQTQAAPAVVARSTN